MIITPSPAFDFKGFSDKLILVILDPLPGVIKISFSVLAILIALPFSCMNPTTLYKYADGNGNTYSVSADMLKYDPVSPGNSSSGMYSGGEPWEVPLSREQYESVASLLEEAIGAREEHQNAREMMTGSVSRTRKDKVTVILKRNSPIKIKVEEMLKNKGQ